MPSTSRPSSAMSSGCTTWISCVQSPANRSPMDDAGVQLRRSVLRGLARRESRTTYQRAGARRRAHGPPGQRPARLCPLSAPGRHRLLAGLHGRRADPPSAASPASSTTCSRRCSIPQAARTTRERRTDPEVTAKHIAAPPSPIQLAEVPSIDDDRILRRFLTVVDRDAAHQLFQPRTRRRIAHIARLQARFARRSRACPIRSPSARSSSSARRSRACICASARSPAAACAGRTVPRITAPRCSASSRRSRSRTP